MLHQYILFAGLLLSNFQVARTFFGVRGDGQNREEVVLSVMFGVSFFGLVISALGILHGVPGGLLSLLVTAQEWLVIVGSFVTCHYINGKHKTVSTGEDNVARRITRGYGFKTI